MVEMRCFYPDGSYAECRYAMPLNDAIEIYDPLFDYDARQWDEVASTQVDASEWDEPTLGGEG